MDTPPLFWSIIICITAVKILLIPSYKSTDFEVHRNWLAITHSLPINRWYYEATSQWTLDYPPLFAWFEYGLSQVAKYVDANMLKVSNLNYSSQATVLFQRASVIVTDLVLAFAVTQCCKVICHGRKHLRIDVWADDRFILAMILLTNVGLLIVDHIHFQYNGFLFGILLLSIARMMQDRPLESAFWFATLLNLKHLFLYIAPVYGVYLLRNYCFQKDKRGSGLNWRTFSILNLLKIGAVVLTVFAISFGPFIYLGQLPQVLRQLFPFKRGLSHSYWAPNFWALYNTLDKVAITILLKTGSVEKSNVASMTGGLVKEYHHQVLPSVSPTFTLIATLLAMLPCLWVLWNRPRNHWEFVRCLVLSSFASFMFGWHVHEKAILMVIIPLSLLAIARQNAASVFAFLSVVGHFSLFPLLFTEAEIPTKLLMMLLYSAYIFYSFAILYRDDRKWKWPLPLLTNYESVYLIGLGAVYLYGEWFHRLLGLDKTLPFVPLMITSSYCSIGITYSWLKLNWITWTESRQHATKYD